MQTKLYFFTKNTYATWSRLSRLDYHSVTIRLALGYHSVTTLNVTEGGHKKNRLPLYEEAHFWDYLVMLVVLVALVVLDKLDCI